MPIGNLIGYYMGAWFGDGQITPDQSLLPGEAGWVGNDVGNFVGDWLGDNDPVTPRPKLIDRLVSKIDRIRQRVNVDKVGVRRYRLFRVIRTWDGGEVGDGLFYLNTEEITPAPEVTLGKSRDRLVGAGRVDAGTMTATEVSLTYSESYLFPTLSSGQECYYRLTEMNPPQGYATTYWHLDTKPEADRAEKVSGNVQWILNFTRAQISE
jgi:hypothetical protein